MNKEEKLRIIFNEIFDITFFDFNDNFHSDIHFVEQSNLKDNVLFQYKIKGYKTPVNVYSFSIYYISPEVYYDFSIEHCFFNCHGPLWNKSYLILNKCNYIANLVLDDKNITKQQLIEFCRNYKILG